MKKLTTEERRRRRFSESFRKARVKEIEKGLVRISDVSRLYEVKMSSIQGWLKKYGTKERPGIIMVETTDDINRLKAQEEEIKRLKEIIADMHLKSLETTEYLAIAKEKLGENFLKKTKPE